MAFINALMFTLTEKIKMCIVHELLINAHSQLKCIFTMNRHFCYWAVCLVKYRLGTGQLLQSWQACCRYVKGDFYHIRYDVDLCGIIIMLSLTNHVALCSSESVERAHCIKMCDKLDVGIIILIYNAVKFHNTPKFQPEKRETKLKQWLHKEKQHRQQKESG